MNALKLITGPTLEPVTLEEAMTHLRVVDSDEASLITALITASREYAEEHTGRVFYSQTFDLYFDQFPVETSVSPRAIVLPKSPLIEVNGVFYRDSNDVEQTFDSANYLVDSASEHPRVTLTSSSSWPSTRTGFNAGRIRFRAGHVDNTFSPVVGTVPEIIRSGILLLLGHLYDHREEVVIGQTAVNLPLGVKALLDMKRVDISLA